MLSLIGGLFKFLNFYKTNIVLPCNVFNTRGSIRMNSSSYLMALARILAIEFTRLLMRHMTALNISSSSHRLVVSVAVAFTLSLLTWTNLSKRIDDTGLYRNTILRVRSKIRRNFQVCNRSGVLQIVAKLFLQNPAVFQNSMLGIVNVTILRFEFKRFSVHTGGNNFTCTNVPASSKTGFASIHRRRGYRFRRSN